MSTGRFSEPAGGGPAEKIVSRAADTVGSIRHVRLARRSPARRRAVLRRRSAVVVPLAAVVVATTLTTLGAGPAEALTPGLTKAPDAIGGTFRAGADPEHAAVDIRWDAVAVADSGGSGSAFLVTLDGVAVECLTPATGSATPSGGVTPGGNNTALWTAVCGPIPSGTYAGQRPGTSNTARLMILGDTARDEAGLHFNGLEQVNVSVHGRTNNLPDLLSATFSNAVPDGNGHTVDKALFTFSKPIATLNAPGSVGVIPVNGGDEATIADSSGPFPGDGPLVDGSSVRIFFPVGTLTQAVQGFVLGEAVTDTSGRLNQAGSTGAAAGTDPGPTVAHPTLHIDLGAGLNIDPTGAHVPATLRWTASDPTVTIDHYEISQAIGGAAPTMLGTAPGAARSFAVTVEPRHSYVFTVHGFDSAGADAARSTPPLHLTMPNDNLGAITYRGTWRTVSSTGAIRKDLHVATKVGASATFRFTGREVALVATRAPRYGRALVYVDGRRRDPISLHSTKRHDRRVVLTRHFSTAGSHTVKLVPDGPATHPDFNVDAFIVIQ